MNSASRARPLELKQVRVLLAVAAELHFGRAAERLGMPQPAVSQVVRRLEARIGLPLFERTTRSVRLTKAGEAFIARARFGAAMFDSAVCAAEETARSGATVLHLGFVQPAIHACLPTVLREFRRRHPQILVKLSEMSSQEQYKALLDGRIEAGILRPSGAAQDVRTTVIAREGFVVALPAGHPLTRRSRIDLGALSADAFIEFRPIVSDLQPHHVASMCRAAGFDPRPAAETSSISAAAAMVAAGMGIAILPAWIRRSGPPGVVFRPVPALPEIVELAAAWPDLEPVGALRALLDTIADVTGAPLLAAA